MAVVKDWRGTTIKIGATVVYPSRQQGTMWVTEGEVVSVQDGRVGVRRKRSTDGYRYTADPIDKKPRIAYPLPSRITVV